jgi:hypothetical protein
MTGAPEGHDCSEHLCPTCWGPASPDRSTHNCYPSRCEDSRGPGGLDPSLHHCGRGPGVGSVKACRCEACATTPIKLPTAKGS